MKNSKFLLKFEFVVCQVKSNLSERNGNPDHAIMDYGWLFKNTLFVYAILSIYFWLVWPLKDDPKYSLLNDCAKFFNNVKH